MDAVVVFLTAAVVTAVGTPLAKRLSVRMGAIAVPDDRKVHDTAMPTLGGLAILGGVGAAVVVAWRLDGYAAVFDAPTVPLGLLVAATVAYAVGAIDDVREISAPAKTAGTVLAGSILNLAGITILLFRLPSVGLISLSPDWAALVTVLWVVGMCQAINLIDGLDGLAAGIVGIASFALYLFAAELGDLGQLPSDNIAPLVALATAGACAGFLPYNAHPASVFMGDGGALLLGLLMAAASIGIGGNSTADSSSQTFFFSTVHPARDPRRADLRHGVRHHPPRAQSDRRDRGRQGAPAPPAHGPGAWAAAQRGDPLDLDGVAIGPRAVSRLHRHRRRRAADRHRRARAVALHDPAPAGPRRAAGAQEGRSLSSAPIRPAGDGC